MSDKVTEDKLEIKTMRQWVNDHLQCGCDQEVGYVCDRCYFNEYLDTVKDQLSTVTKQLEEAVEVVSWYADKSNWERVNQFDYLRINNDDEEGTHLFGIGGKLAREFLAKLKGER
jgi:hypothetical protein